MHTAPILSFHHHITVVPFQSLVRFLQTSTVVEGCVGKKGPTFARGSGWLSLHGLRELSDSFQKLVWTVDGAAFLPLLEGPF